MHHHPHNGHSHSHAASAARDNARGFLPGICLNGAFILIEIVMGFRAHSLALLSDAGHNFGDVLALGLGLSAARLASSRPTTRYTYGFKSFSILAALANAVLLLLITGGIVCEAVQRLLHPGPSAGATVACIAGLGILVNGGTALLFTNGRDTDLNRRAAFLHMLSDAVMAGAVVLTGALVAVTGWQFLDPLVSLCIAFVIIFASWRLLRESADLALHAVPPHVDMQAVRAYLSQQDGVREVHDLHVWAMGTTDTALSAHLLMPGGAPGDDFIHRVSGALAERFRIHHVTVQIESGDVPCALAPDHIV